MMSQRFYFFGGFVYTGLGARSVASLGGRGARLWRPSVRDILVG